MRSSLEEEFKKHVLGLSNSDSSSSSSLERLKDLSASASSRLGGGDLATGGGSSSGPGQQGAVQPPGPDSSQQQREEGPSTPFMAHLPLSSEPYHPLEFYPTSQIDMDWGVAGVRDEQWMSANATERSRCFVILFGVGRAETEGIYSLRAVAKDDGLPVDTIVAFENQDDAQRYATLLEATMDHEPTVWPIEWGELLEFCNSSGYRCRLEPAGSLLIPPDYNVALTDWEKSLKLRRGEFGVLGTEPAGASSGGLPDYGLAGGAGFFLDGANWVFEQSLMPQDEEELQTAQLSAVIDSQLSSPAALEAMRASLERMLPQE